MMKSCLLVFAVACSSPGPNPKVPANTSAPATATPDETSGATACTRDDECYCRVFDGAQFAAGREPSACCTDAAGCTDAVGASVVTNHCMTCVYD